MSLITTFQDRWRQRKTSAQEWLWEFLTTIAEHNERINAVLELNPHVFAEADRADRIARYQPGGLLAGVPVLVKDNIAVGGDMHTTAGSLSLKDNYAVRDAFVIKQIRGAGGMILGKTNLTEWANFMSDHMPNGYSSYGGQVMNPYGPGIFDVGGSSSGSGAAIAAGFAPVALGTETSGSILSPSSQNSLVGIKPTIGLVSRSGIVPIAYSQDTAGPMATTVTDAAILLTVIQGFDPEDPVTALAPGFPDYRRDLIADGLKKRRLGVPRQRYLDQASDEELAIFNHALNILRDAGADIVDPADIETANENWTYDVLLYEFPAALNAYLNKWTSKGPKTLKDVIDFNNAHSQEALRYGQSVLMESFATQGRLTDARYLMARQRDLKWSQRQGIDKTLEDYRLDALVFINNRGADIAARAGYPSITVPMGYTQTGKPLGLTFTAGAFQESLLIQLAFAFEQATKLRKAPVLG
ncbi:amidase family protein [Sulfobacillus thermosulfidooxidans]|uniref:amidase family protein n=1 Tax=Sulfobacillus thermosulfidooxidans TaxID=28034 RepID=UPI0006B67DBE|nr:amidase family protein [Sulfobacillus thermosulfidooxidans]